MKTCKECHRTLDDGQFNKNCGMHDGRLNTCKDCVAAYAKDYRSKNREVLRKLKSIAARKRKYNITPDEMYGIFEKQGKVCAICGRNNPTGRGWQVDHEHTTGKVRGILCHRCNTAIGMLKDDPNLLQQALDYLRRHDGTLPAEEDWDSWFTRWVS